MGYRRPAGSGAAAGRIPKIRAVLWLVLALNVGVALAKLIWGTISQSAAMQADGFHSLFDGTSNIVGLVGMSLAAKPADADHPYGHGKYETYASAAIGGMLVLAAYRVGSGAIAHLTGNAENTQVTTMSFVVMIVTLSINIFITTWERRAGKRLGSEILLADANHTRSDILVSLGVIVSLVLVKLGFHQADGIVALLVAFAIAITAWDVFKSAGATLSDTARIPVEDVRQAVLGVSGVLGTHHVRTRGSEAEVYVDLHVQVDETRSVAEGHGIAEEVERMLVERFPQVVDAIVHLEPFDAYQAKKTVEEMNADEQ